MSSAKILIMFLSLSGKCRKKAHMLLEEGACEEMMEYFNLMRIEQNSGKHICQKL